MPSEAFAKGNFASARSIWQPRKRVEKTRRASHSARKLEFDHYFRYFSTEMPAVTVKEEWSLTLCVEQEDYSLR